MQTIKQNGHSTYWVQVGSLLSPKHPVEPLSDLSIGGIESRSMHRGGGCIGVSGCFTLIVRSYQGENVRSRPISETKHLWANSVLTWGTSWESLVLNVFAPQTWGFDPKPKGFEPTGAWAWIRSRPGRLGRLGFRSRQGIRSRGNAWGLGSNPPKADRDRIPGSNPLAPPP